MRRSMKMPRWGVVLILAALYVVSLVDRQIIALLADPIAQSLQVSDTQIGILYGLGFGLLYMIIGFPIAHYIDRNPRLGIVVMGVLLWSACTAGSAFAPSFLFLLLLRSGVAIGEAVLTPAAVSIIGDLFPLEQRALPMAIYASVGGIMNTGAFFVGGAAYAYASQASGGLDLEPWRATLLIVGLPGIVLALIIASFAVEPQRRGDDEDKSEFHSVSAALAYVRNEAGFLFPFFLSVGLTLMVAAGFMTWTPTILVRAFDVSVANAGVTVGLIGMVFVALGSFFWPLLGDRLTKSGRKDGLIISFAIAQAMSLMLLAASTLAPTKLLFLTALAGCLFCVSAVGALPSLAIQAVVPNRMRGRISALHLMFTTIGGVVLGPPLIAAVSDSVFSGDRSLLSSGLAFSVVFAPMILVAMLSTRKRFATAVDAAMARESMND